MLSSWTTMPAYGLCELFQHRHHRVGSASPVRSGYGRYDKLFSIASITSVLASGSWLSMTTCARVAVLALGSLSTPASDDDFSSVSFLTSLMKVYLCEASNSSEQLARWRVRFFSSSSSSIFALSSIKCNALMWHCRLIHVISVTYSSLRSVLNRLSGCRPSVAVS